MHEQSIIKSIIRDAEEFGEVLKIVIDLGELAPIEAGHLKEHLREHVDWELEVNTEESRVNCLCGYDSRPEIVERGHDYVTFKCPSCGFLMPRVVSGDKIVIREVDLKE